MKWFNHKHTAGAIVFAFTGNPLPVIPAVLGSIIPDLLEGMPDEEDPDQYNEWRKKHRRLTHWFVPYLTVFVVLYLFVSHKGISHLGYGEIYSLFHKREYLYAIIAYILCFAALGGLIHIAADSICGKVPSVNPHKRVGVKMFKVGSLLEYVIAFAITLTMLQISGVPVLKTISNILHRSL